MVEERRNLSRRTFSYYVRVMDEINGELIGLLADISTTGFKLDCKRPLLLDVNFKMRVEQIGDISNKNFVSLVARTKWCRRDEFDPSMFSIGFQLIDISRTDYDIFLKMFDAYSVQKKPNGG